MARTRTELRRAGVLLTLVLMLLSACGAGGVEMHEDAQLSAKLQELRRAGGTAHLRELVPGDWDRVHSFAEPASRELVQDVVGEPVEMGEIFYGPGNLLVFEKSGQVQRVLTVSVNIFDGSYGADVRLIARPPNTGRITLAEPEADNGG